MLYLIQFIVTSCCDCPNETSGIKYTGLELSTWSTNELESTETSNIDSNNDFSISVYIESEINTIVDLLPNLNISNLGFSSAYATSCDCIIELIQTDPIVDIEISVINTRTQETTVVTNNFEPNGYENFEELLSDDIGYLNDDYQFSMLTKNNIPDISVFIVKFILKSGIELTEQTQEVTFE